MDVVLLLLLMCCLSLFQLVLLLYPPALWVLSAGLLGWHLVGFYINHNEFC